jgi:sulfonate transport system substrate-binding protein
LPPTIWSQKKREQARAFLKAYQRGAQFIKSNPREAASLIAGDVNLSSDLLLKVISKFDYHPAIQADDVEELKKSEAFMYGAGIIKSHVPVDSFVDTKLTRESGIK